jgi:excisionase family DNA binding protein
VSFGLEIPDDALERLADLVAERVAARMPAPETTRLDTPKMLNVEEVRQRLGFEDPRTVRALIESGELIGYKIGREYRVAADDLASFLEGCRLSPHARPRMSAVPSRTPARRGRLAEVLNS